MKNGGRCLKSGEEGFTMVELLISILVSTIVLGAISAAFVLQNKSYAKQEQVVDVQENARAALQLMTKELLMAGYDPSGNANAGILVADDDRVQFTMDLDQDEAVTGSGENITYALDTTENQVTRTSGGGSAQPIGESIQALSFKYFDSDDLELTSVPLNSSDREEVTRVSVELEPLFPQSLSFNIRGDGTYNDFVRLAHAGVVRACEAATFVLSPSYAFAGPRRLKDSVKPPNLGKRGAVGDMANDETWKNSSSSSSSQCSFKECMPDMGRRCAMGFQPLQNEQGAILVIAVIFVAVLAISGTTAYQMTANEFLIARNFDNSRKALNAASAGVEEARVRMGLPSADTFAINDPYSSASWAPSPTSLQTDLDPKIEIQHKADATSGDFFYYGYPSSDPLKISAFSSSSPTEYRPIDIITSTGTYENSKIEIRAEVVRNPGPPILAALYAEIDVDGDASNNALNISGTDSCTAGACPFCGNVSKSDVYVHPSTADPQLDDSNLSPADPLPTIVTGNNDININQGITSLKEWETSSTPSACYNSNYDICSSSSDLTITNQTGSGVLLVEGNLTLEQTSWDGLILVAGELILNGGAGGIFIQGAVLVNGEVWINPCNPSPPDCDSGSEGPVTINYNSCAIDAALGSIPLRVLNWEDRSITD